MRHQDWETRLQNSIEQWLNVEFEWGKADCCCESDSHVYAITGDSYMSDVVGTYTTAEEAQQTIKDCGHRDLYRMLNARLGKPIKATYAQRGDVVYRKASLEGGAVGICIGAEALFKSDTGHVRCKLRDCARAWRIQ